jgi:hypothetical protein
MSSRVGITSPPASKRDTAVVGTAVDAVLANHDLLRLLLSGTVGPSSYATLAQTCCALRDFLYADAQVLRSAALYSGGLTKDVFCALFCLRGEHVDALFPYAQRHRFRLFGADAVDCALRSADPMTDRRLRLRVDAQLVNRERRRRHSTSKWHARKSKSGRTQQQPPLLAHWPHWKREEYHRAQMLAARRMDRCSRLEVDEQTHLTNNGMCHGGDGQKVL